MRRSELLLLGALGCAGAPAPVDSGDVQTFACELGTLDGNGAFVPFAESDEAELVLGFQGLLMLLTHVRAEDAPDPCWAVGSVTPEADDPSNTNQPFLPFDEAGISEQLVLYLPSNVPSAYAGRRAELAVRVEGKDATCVATASVLLVDEDPCIGGTGGCTGGDR